MIRPEWHYKGICGTGEHDPEVWFPVTYTANGAPTRALRKAQSLCAQCPVKKDCLDEALGLVMLAGVWAGTTPADRHQMRAELARQGVRMESDNPRERLLDRQWPQP